MNDLDVMKRAKQYIESLANGIDPLTGDELPSSDIVNNVRISRCLFYTAGVLQKVISNGGEVKRDKTKRSYLADFSLTEEQMLALKPAERAITISRIADIINQQIDVSTMKRLKATTLNQWLIQKGLVTEVIINGNSHKLPTAAGESMGIVKTDCVSQKGSPYTRTDYTPEAQQFIFDNIESIIVFAANESSDNRVSAPISDSSFIPDNKPADEPPAIPENTEREPYIDPTRISAVIRDVDDE